MRAAAAALMLASACVSGGEADAPPGPEDLVREGTRPSEVRRGDLDGDGRDELVVASVSQEPAAFGLPTPYLEVFARSGEGWEKVFDASEQTPEGEGPGTMLEPPDEQVAVGQRIDVLDLVDLEEDGSSQLVAAISNAGATAGPLELWILSMSEDRSFRTDYFMSTERGGKVAVFPGHVAIEFAVYKKGDPGCCPSAFEVRTIGRDPESGRIGVLERQRHPLAQP